MRRGFSLLELVVACAMMATIGSSVTLLLRTSQNAWDGLDSDQQKLENAHAAVRHMVRQLRQTTAVTAITAANNNNGSLSATLTSGSTYIWTHSGTQIQSGTTTANNILAEQITSLRFTGYEADAATATTVVANIRAVKITATVTLARDANATRTISSWAWLRAW